MQTDSWHLVRSSNNSLIAPVVSKRQKLCAIGDSLLNFEFCLLNFAMAALGIVEANLTLHKRPFCRVVNELIDHLFPTVIGLIPTTLATGSVALSQNFLHR